MNLCAPVGGLDVDGDEFLAVKDAQCPAHGHVARLAVRYKRAVQDKGPFAAVDPQVPLTVDVGDALRGSRLGAVDIGLPELRLTGMHLGCAELHRDERPVPALREPRRMAEYRLDDLGNRMHDPDIIGCCLNGRQHH